MRAARKCRCHGVPSLLQHSLALLRAPANQLAFAVRSRLRWSKGPVQLPHEDKAVPLPWLEGAAAREAVRCLARLVADYDLAALQEHSTRLVLAENVDLLVRLRDLLGDLPSPVAAGTTLAAIDVGCGLFQYATALQRGLARVGGGAPHRVLLRGVEIDGFGIYRDGHSRADHARAHAALAGGGVGFEVADFARLELPPQDVVTMFYPFLSAYPLLRWGSPLTHLGPRRLLQRAVAALRPGGWLLVASQTDAEFVRLRDLLRALPVRLVRQVRFAGRFVPYADRTLDRVGSLWVREVVPGPAPVALGPE